MQTINRRIDVRKRPKYISYLSLPYGNGGTVSDISAGGLSFEAIAPLRVDGPIPVRFSIDSATRINAVGELAWLDESGKRGGLRFTEMPEHVREQIRIWASQSGSDAQSMGMAADRADASARTDDIEVTEMVAEFVALLNGKPEPVSAQPLKRLLYNVEPPIYSSPSYELSMFPAELTYNPHAAGDTFVDEVADLLSAVSKRPMVAVGLVIAFEVLLSVGIFALVSSTLAGPSAIDWSEKTLLGTNSQPASQTVAPPSIGARGFSKLGPR